MAEGGEKSKTHKKVYQRRTKQQLITRAQTSQYSDLRKEVHARANPDHSRLDLYTEDEAHDIDEDELVAPDTTSSISDIDSINSDIHTSGHDTPILSDSPVLNQHDLALRRRLFDDYREDPDEPLRLYPDSEANSSISSDLALPIDHDGHIMAAEREMANAVASLAQHMNALTARLDDFSGTETENVTDFITDFQRYCEHLGQDTSEERKIILSSRLKKDAKKWYRLQPIDRNTDELLQSLLERFRPTPQSLLNRKVALFAVKQQPDQTFKEYVAAIREKARPLGIPEAELVNICLAGSSPAIRAHLTMASPQTFRVLLNLPVAQDPSIVQTQEQTISAVINEIQDLKSALTKRVTFHDRQRSRSTTPERRTTRMDSPAPEAPSARREHQTRDPRDPTGPASCTRCGKQQMGESQVDCINNQYSCAAYEAICFVCSNRGHFAKFCRSRGPRIAQNYNYNPRAQMRRGFSQNPSSKFNFEPQFRPNYQRRDQLRDFDFKYDGQRRPYQNAEPPRAYRFDRYPPQNRFQRRQPPTNQFRRSYNNNY